MEVNGEVRGTAFAGPISSTYGCIFITITDINFQGLPEVVRVELMSAFPNLFDFNELYRIVGDQG